ncbi:preprotein translocase subunit SecA [Candidatus Borkfalkia ceftriaxoniphila]|uniref:Protein translocase subunit SecA n=1 Tax=Candidatus Borkfalkia ceftriaxoniphila TaxID=2508949 RepID=A0A4Q2KBQ5_9FIRM|nr:preprotein translocase subunit SecA [Candidatus Borkfalkia ceftriaxoniphila]RXZ62005.1 preprotein translocase subunit SecA [Candidatus Borkfalkia ceftriaxoniphila]
MGLINYMLNSDGRRSLKKLDKMALKVEALEPKYAAMGDEELKSQTGILKDRLAKGETTDDILYDAFAVVREAANRVLKLKHYHVQIIGGIALYQGRIAEMKTGEGKTLVATLPAYLAALTGKGVHIVTVNDYLAQRDAEWMGKVHRFLGLTVGVVVPGMDDDDKKKAYNCDITYATNNELGFDYLRDNLKTDIDKMVQRELAFGIVDEVDSILIDEARTPLIISGKGDKSSELYERVDRFVRTLKGGFDDDGVHEEDTDKKKKKKKKEEIEEPSEETGEIEEEIDEKFQTGGKYGDWDYVIDRKDRSVQITELGAAKAERFFNIENLGDIDNAALNHHIQQALKAHKLFHRDEDYIVNDGEVVIVDEFTGRLMIGRRYSDGLHQAIEAKEGVKVRNENKTYATITFQNFFRLYKKLSGMTGTAKTEEGEFRTIYSLDVLEIPTNKPVVRKDMPDMVYSTVEGKKRAILKEIMTRHESGQPILIGTATVEKSEEIAKLLRKNGVKHNILNAKNHEREAEIVAQAGRLGAVTIATNMAGRGTDILLGGNPEYLAKKRLREEGVEHELIELATSYAELEGEAEEVRRRYQELYAEYKAETDAEKLKVIEAGGLCILGTERHESRRIDNQLRGRSGRQGDPGVSVFFLSLEDDLIKRFGGETMKKIYNVFSKDDNTCLQSRMLSRGIENAQKAIEGRNFGIRKTILQYDDVMNKQREVIYAERMKVLKGENVHDEVVKFIPDFVTTVLKGAVNVDEMPEKWDAEALNRALEQRLLPEGSGFVTQDKLNKWDYDYAFKKIVKETEKAYDEKIAEVREQFGIDYADVERRFLLMNVDRNWIDQIDAMDQLRKGIGLRAYGNVDPVISYKQEGFEMFDEMIERIQTGTISMLLKVRIEVNRPAVRPVEAPKNLTDNAELVTNRSAEGAAKPVTKSAKEIGRNDPCPCGSGKKYKNCCGKNA